MKYKKPEVEVIQFDYSEFMTGSMDSVSCPSDAGKGHTCETYVKGSSCSSWTTTAFGGGSCSNYNGHKCYGYTDPTHHNCSEYGVTCSKF